MTPMDAWVLAVCGWALWLAWEGDPQMSERERFVVTEHSGYPMTTGGGAALQTEVMVLDRAYCHRVVWSSLTTVMDVEYASTRYGRKGNRIKDAVRRGRATAFAWPIEKRRAYAVDLARRLNADRVTA